MGRPCSKASGKDANSPKAWKKSEKVNMKSFDNLVHEFGVPDFCKIDVEGMEKDILCNLTKPIGTISFEFSAPDFISDSKEIVSHLGQIGYVRYNISFGESLEFEFAEWQSEREILNFLDNDSSLQSDAYGDIYCMPN